MNAIVKAWRNFKIRVATRRQGIVENKFRIGDWVVARNQQARDQQLDSNAGEVVDAFYGFDMNRGYKWQYKVQYKRSGYICTPQSSGGYTVVVLYEEQEICIDAAWIRDKKIKELGI